MLSGRDFEFRYTREQVEGKGIDALSEDDLVKMLRLESTRVEVKQGEGLLLPQIDGDRCEILRPRVRVMEPSLNPTDDAFLEARFGVVITVPSDQFVPHLEEGRGGHTADAAFEDVDGEVSVDDVVDAPEDAAIGDDPRDGDDVEMKHVLDSDGNVTEVPVENDETEGE